MNCFTKLVVGQMLAFGFLSTGSMAADSTWVTDADSLDLGITYPLPSPAVDSPLEDGKVYQIISKASGRCLDVFDHLLSRNAVLKQWDCTGENHQKFVAHQVFPGGVYTFSPLRSPELSLAIAENSQDNGAVVIQKKSTDLTKNILVEKLDDGTFTVGFLSSSKCLDLDNASYANGSKVQQWDCSSSDNQRWTFKKVSVADQTKTYNLKSKFSNLCLDVTDHALQDGALIQQYGCWTGDNQAFVLSQRDGEYVTIRGVESGKSVVVAGGSRHNGADIVQYSVSPKIAPSAVQYLVPVAGKANTYEVRFASTGFCLTVAFDSKLEGSRMQQYSCGRGASQEWELIERK